MQAANRLRTALQTGKGVSFGAWQMLPGANHSRIMARSGFDWICVDTEHGNIADDQMHEAVAAIAATGVSPVVRIAANESWMVKRALDAGAHGIVVPLLHTVDDARKLVESAKFPPLGRRGFGSPFSMGSFGNLTQTDYLLQANEALVTIVQIETKEAFENVEEIAKVPGVDVLLVGPWDLGNNISRPVMGDFHPDLVAAIERIRKAAVDNGKKAGIYSADGDSASKYAEQGFHMISVISDVAALPAHLSNSLNTARAGL
ncbi:HpcH/HpaI aldolase/citrate lyase family protein [Histoplasma capsulatum var. duboisii H88]|uniref:HpcH/HpaI aldolase/citrate lyase family protein n=1 Tax=Ajellomyces capsulatus (strain H88) TaxID=544711 RepID=A0A8A1L641_AJEC8|nr:HpcH/HpaI aldolase/citrate lyase family protein [Histoplasma capsulatum var. duboisii H88]